MAQGRSIEIRYIYWQSDDMLLGYMEEYPDYWTQGSTQEELEENLADIYTEVNDPETTIPLIRKVGKMQLELRRLGGVLKN